MPEKRHTSKKITFDFDPGLYRCLYVLIDNSHYYIFGALVSRASELTRLSGSRALSEYGADNQYIT